MKQNNEIPRYCAKCGTELAERKGDVSYHPITGRKILGLECPEIKKYHKNVERKRKRELNKEMKRLSELPWYKRIFARERDTYFFYIPGSDIGHDIISAKEIYENNQSKPA